MVESAGNGRYRIVSDQDGQQIAYAARDRGGTWVFVAGRTYFVPSLDVELGSTSAGSDDQRLLSAPMPASVLAINVAPKQQVREGDLLIMLEAMKMELPIKAPRAGIVKSIGCREGDLVQPGVPLLELEPLPAT